MANGSLSLSESDSVVPDGSLSLSDNRTGAIVEPTCPPLNETVVPLNLLTAGARPCLERLGLMPAHRMPGPRIDPEKLKSHEIPLEAPYPSHEGLGYLTGSPPPDRGQTYHWPHPQREAPTDESS